jgi:hypothetical protein
VFDIQVLRRGYGVRVMIFNATFNNISVLSTILPTITLQQVGGFLRVFQFPLPIKLTTMI